MDLKSDNPFWLLKNGLIASYPALDQDVVCDVAVVGGGVTGAMIANRLVDAGVDTVVLDRRDVGQGSTSATTALLLYEIDTHLCDLAKRIGQEPAQRAYLLCVKAIGKLEQWIAELPETCGFERKQSLYLASTPDDVQALEDECAARNRCGIRVEFLNSQDLGQRCGIAAPAALLSADAAQVDAYRLTHRFFQHDAQRRGLRVFDRTEVTQYKELPNDRIRLMTDRGFSVSARRIVFATGYEAQSHLKQRVVKLKSTYAFVTQPLTELNGWPRQYLLWETSRPYIYVRMTDDGRIMIGGEDDEIRSGARRDARIPQKTKRLQKRLGELLPDVSVEAEFSWAGTFGETKDGLPYIGESAEFPHAYFGLGFGGNGITCAVLAAEIICDLYCQHGSQDADLFRFDR